MRIAEFLVGCIDEGGYIRQSLEDVIDDLAFTQNIIVEYETINNILKTIQNLRPCRNRCKNTSRMLIITIKKKTI